MVEVSGCIANTSMWVQDLRVSTLCKNAEGQGCMMQEIQKDFYLVLFMFASQFYFYVLGHNSLLGYQYFNLEAGLFL